MKVVPTQPQPKGKTDERIGATALFHRFALSLYGHVHLYICEVDIVFEDAPGDRGTSQKCAVAPVGLRCSAVNEILATSVSNVDWTPPLDSRQSGRTLIYRFSLAPLSSHPGAPADDHYVELYIMVIM